MESILVHAASVTSSVTARIFTAEEELPFAGHPVIGAAAVLHDHHAAEESSYEWSFQIAGREIAVRSHQNAVYYRAEMIQGQATLGPQIDHRQG